MGRLLERLSLGSSISAEYRLALTELLILQRRIPEAMGAFAQVDVNQLHSRLQYDYMDAWLRFSRGDWRGGRELAEVYRDHPVQRWRSLFRAVLTQAEEIDGGSTVRAERTLDTAAGAEPLLGARIEGGRLIIEHARLESVEIRYHRVEPEALFSSDPFGRGQSTAFGFVEPERRDRVELKAGDGRIALEIPKELGGADLMVEVRGGGISRRVRHTMGSIVIQPIERFGELRVVGRESGEPLPRVYVKIYSRTKGGSLSLIHI